jgi:hypothetical protein
MTHQTHYETVSKAIEELRKRGYTTDLNIEGNFIKCSEGKFSAGDFEIEDVYRYEGISDPGDEAAVYAIKALNGIKGIFVTGYGISADTDSNEILEKLNEVHRK